MRKFFISICIILIGVISNSFGQFYPDSWTLGPNWAYSRAMNDIEIARIAMQGNISSSLLKESRSQTARKQRKIATGVTAFKADQPYLLPASIAGSFNGTVRQKQELKKTLELAVKSYELRALKQGYPSNDLAFAITYFFYNNYAVYQSIKPMWSNSGGEMQYLVSRSPIFEGQVRGTYLQFSKLLSGQTSLKNLSDTDKQQIAEYLAISTTIFFEAYAEVEPKLNNDMKQVAKLKEIARNNLEGLMGVTIDRIKLGDNGILVSK